VVKQEEGHSLARALGKHSVVLMKRHGATVVGGGLKELVSRSIFMCQNAEYQMRALALGTPQPLHPARSSSPARST
jgi:ribulose-5-phosphate 4-epimerase/fuculose-1-phosphate aldolase